jgi:hypothetical protein
MPTAAANANASRIAAGLSEVSQPNDRRRMVELPVPIATPTAPPTMQSTIASVRNCSRIV